MQRRQFVKNSLLSLIPLSLASSPSAFARSKRKFRWRLVLAIPKTLPIWGELLQAYSKKIELMTEGGLQIKVYGAKELVPALGTFDAVKSGVVEMGHSASYYWQGKIPESVFFCAVPFGLDANGMQAWIQHA